MFFMLRVKLHWSEGTSYKALSPTIGGNHNKAPCGGRAIGRLIHKHQMGGGNSDPIIVRSQRMICGWFDNTRPSGRGKICGASCLIAKSYQLRLVKSWKDKSLESAREQFDPGKTASGKEWLALYVKPHACLLQHSHARSFERVELLGQVGPQEWS